jgi:sulfofructose kinase
MAKHVVTVGNSFLDRILRVPSLLLAPGKLRAKGMDETGGGIAATAAYTVARLEGQASCVSRIGSDASGDAIVARLTGGGVSTQSMLRVPNARSPQGTIIVDPKGERMAFGFMGDAFPDDASWIDDIEFGHIDAVMADYSWPAGAEKVIARARRDGAVVVLDADVGDMDAVRRLLPAADHVVFSKDCLARLTGSDDIVGGVHHASSMTPSSVAVTNGEAGVYWLDRGTVNHLPAFAVKALDTNGAGDIFHGAFALGLAEGMDTKESFLLASATAALKCATGSGWESIPDRKTVDQFLTRRNK